MIGSYIGVLVAASVLANSLVSCQDPVVQTNNGQIQGQQRVTSGEGREYFSFQGIPFAEPPTGPLRFQPPVPKQNWTGILLTTQDNPGCVQSSNPVIGQEDCLTVNIFTPQLNRAAELPVMIWIFGGGFNGGSANTTLFNPEFFMEQDVIICHLNHRLGALGFLSTGDQVVPGNNGLRDQILAIQWIKANIENFGGNPNNITLFGQSSGAASISFQLQIPQNEGLFQKAIMESGTSICLWTRARSARKSAFDLGRQLNIWTSSSTTLVQRLRTMDYATLQTAAQNVIQNNLLLENPKDGATFAPVIEVNHTNAIFSTRSHERMTRGDFLKVPTIIGFNTLEGTFEYGIALSLLFARYDVAPAEIVPINMNIQNPLVKTSLGLEIKLRYLGLTPAAAANVNLMKFISIDQFVRPIREFARLLSRHTNTYLYVFSYEGALWGWANRTTPGTTHSEELGYLWPSFYENVATPPDLLTRRRLIKLWTNFAKTGNPTPAQEELLQNIIWPSANIDLTDNLAYLDIGRNLGLNSNPFNDDVVYWNNLYAAYGHGPYDTR